MTLRHKTLLATGAAALSLLLTGVAQGASPPATEEGEALARTPRELARLLGVSEDDVRPDSQRSFSLFGAPVTLGGEMEASSQADEGFDLDADEADRRVRALPEFKLEARIMPSERMAAFVQAKAYLESDLLDQGGTRSHDSGLRLDQAWLMFPDLLGSGLGLQLGRQKFRTAASGGGMKTWKRFVCTSAMRALPASSRWPSACGAGTAARRWSRMNVISAT